MKTTHFGLVLGLGNRKYIKRVIRQIESSERVLKIDDTIFGETTLSGE